MGAVTTPASSATAGSIATARGFLGRLPADTRQRLLAESTRVPLNKEDHLFEPGMPLDWAYLPCSGLVSLQTMSLEGESVEVAMIGSEGIVGIPGPASTTRPLHTAVVLLEGEAMRVRADVLRRHLQTDAALQAALIQYSYLLINQVAQGSMCHRFHTAKQRLARWLLAASDRTQSLKILMTQERLGQVLGLQRTGVTPASIALQDAGAIKSRHGRITIVDRRRVELLACECYAAARQTEIS